MPGGVQVVKSEAPGLPYAHMWVSDLPGHSRVALNVRLVFFEFPPGHIERALSLSLLNACLMVALSVVYGSVARHAEIGALFLAGVGVVAVWLRPGFESDKLLQAPLSAKVGLAVTGGSALLGGLDFAIAAAGPHDGTAVWVGRAFMIVLTIVALVVVITLGRKLRRSFRDFPTV